jgi:hypothetical protein
MDGGVADTARANTKNSCEHKPLIGESWGKRERRTIICASHCRRVRAVINKVDPAVILVRWRVLSPHVLAVGKKVDRAVILMRCRVLTPHECTMIEKVDPAVILVRWRVLTPHVLAVEEKVDRAVILVRWSVLTPDELSVISFFWKRGAWRGGRLSQWALSCLIDGEMASTLKVRTVPGETPSGTSRRIVTPLGVVACSVSPGNIPSGTIISNRSSSPAGSGSHPRFVVESVGSVLARGVWGRARNGHRRMPRLSEGIL